MPDLLHTTEEEQALLLNHWRNSPTISNIARRLIAEVKRLETERDKFRDLTKRAAAGGLPLAGVAEAELIDKLETENKRLRDERQRWLNHRCVFQ